MIEWSASKQGLGKWERMHGLIRAYSTTINDTDTPLEEKRVAKSNPGNLRMFTYLPSSDEGQSLVVVLHGCGQTAAGYDHGAGWSTLADRYGFALLFPEQQRANNPNGCFNWFEPADTRRDFGEAASIRAMIETVVRDNAIDPRRVFITGLSAGGAMTSAMLACYPEVFAGGAIIAGLPYGSATNVQEAFQCMFQCPTRRASEWGDLVRQASSQHHGPWPRVSVWHGNADQTVAPSNARESLKQWIDVHGLQMTPSVQAVVDGYPREVWLNGAGEEVVESYSITHMAHGAPLSPGDAESECGATGPYLPDVGISSSFHIAKFFGLTGTAARLAPTAEDDNTLPRLSFSYPAESPQAQILDGEILPPIKPRREIPSPGRIDIGAVIAQALQAAGLLRR